MADPAFTLAALKGPDPASMYETLTVDEVQVDGSVNVRTGAGLVTCSSLVSGIKAGDRVFVCKHLAGWVVMGGFAGPSGGPPTGDVPPPVVLPKAIITPDNDGVWQSGHRTTAVNHGHAVQGSADGYPANTGGWFYGTKIADACAGRTPASASVWLGRSSTYHGNPRKVPRPRIGLHDFTAYPSNLTLHDVYTTDTALGLGGDADYPLPSDLTAQLAAGTTAKGLGVTALSGLNEYIQFTANSGVLTLTFNS